MARTIDGLVACGVVCVAILAATACTVTSATVAPDGGLGDSGTPTGDAATATDGAVRGPLGFTPSNVDLGGIDLTKVGDFVVDGDCSIDTDSNLASCGDGASVLGFKLATQKDGSIVAVYVARSLTIGAGKSLTVAGSHPLVFIALDTISIAGRLSGSSREDVGVAGGQVQKMERTKGAGLGGGAASTNGSASGGGSYCGIGGAGGAENGAPSAGGAAYGAAEITPLVAGSQGGDIGGAGGGAIQLVAGTAITIAASGVVDVGAGGGGFGGISTQNAAGGGSGGSVLLESLAVTIAGTLAANGGGGGAGTSNGAGTDPPAGPGGANATPNATPALGGKAGIGPSAGGNGSAAATINGAAGSFTAGNNNAAGGGGGGAGRIRINSKTPATVTGALSPAAGTACVSQGVVQ